MFRNSYMQTYKHAAIANKQLQFLFLHLSQIYATLGSVINDIQYQFGLFLANKQETQKNQQNNKRQKQQINFNQKIQIINNKQKIDNSEKLNFKQLQNRLQNFNNSNQRSKISEIIAPNKQKVVKQSINFVQPKLEKNQRHSRQYFPVIESTQDFDALFLPKRQSNQEKSNQNSRLQAPKNKQTNLNIKSNRKPDEEQIEYMEKLFK